MRNNTSLILFLAAGFVYAQEGALDPSFADNGIALTDVGPSSEMASAIVVQTDQKLVVLGNFYNGDDDDIGLVRYNANGTLDTDFGDNGKVRTEFVTGEDDIARALAVQADGKILVAGRTDQVLEDIALARFNSDGTLDDTFGTGGVTLLDTAQLTEIIHAMVLQPDGKILVAGSSEIVEGREFIIARYNTDGTLDNGFGEEGIAVHGFGFYADVATSMALMPDGRIVVAGWASDFGITDFAAMRFHEDGTLDPTFGTGGKVRTSLSGGTGDQCWGMAIQPDQKVVLVGRVSVGNDTKIGIVRYDANGDLDTTFDGDGKLISAITAHNEIANDVLALADGRILVGGLISADGLGQDFGLVRYEPDGSLDLTFDGDGVVMTDAGAVGDEIQGMALQADGRLVVAGGSASKFAVARYAYGLTSGIVPSAVHNSAITIIPNPATDHVTVEFTLDVSGSVNAVLLDATGREAMVVMDQPTMPAGIHRERIDVGALASGIYTLLVRTPGSARNLGLVKR